MTALYRSGRQAEALEVYQRTRRRFAEELGLEPGPQLMGLQGRILGSDTTLLEQPATGKRSHHRALAGRRSRDGRDCGTRSEVRRRSGG